MYVGPKTTAGIVLVAVAVLAGFGAVWLRSRKSHVDHIVPEVEGAGLTFIASRIPRLWEFGPFPKIHIRVTFIQTEVGPLDGEYSAVRVVRVLDRCGQEHEIWVRLNFTAFRLDTIESRPDLRDVAKEARRG